MTAFKLRPYQEEAIEAVLNAREQGMRRVVISLPTGAGKTVIFSHIIRILRRPALVLAHRSELLDQARAKILAVDPRLTVEVEKADQRASPDAQVVVASIRSLRSERLARLIQTRPFGLVVYDECHHAPALDNTRVLEELGVFDPAWRGILVGFTATVNRADRMGLDKVFEEIIYQLDLATMIRDGYLVPLRGFRITTEADLTHLSPGSGEELDAAELEEAVDLRGRNALVARSIQELARDRKTLAFCVTVKHARNLADALNAIGVPADLVHGEMKPEDRARVLGDLRDGRLAAVTNVGVLTEGFDDPSVSCVAMARPMRSSGLYTQCVGRGTRPHPDKKDCLILDFADLSTLSLVSLPSLFGMPPNLDLEGQEVLEVEERLGQLFELFPTFEVPPDGITLAEIQERAESFDPLTLDLNPDLRAISANAWYSLGSAGIVLYYLRQPQKLGEFLVLDSRQGGKARFQVFHNQEPVTSFARLEEAVEAVDWELAQRPPDVARTALPWAAWRRAAPSPAQLEALAQLRPPRTAATKDDAVRLLAYARYARRSRLGSAQTRSS